MSSIVDPYLKFNHRSVSDRQVDTLIGLCKGIVADGVVNQQEAEFLQNWLAANEIAVMSNPVTCTLLDRVDAMLADGVLDREEAEELLAALHSFSGEPPEVGEFIKTTGLPVDHPEPRVGFSDSTFCFSGTFAYGTRRECEALVTSLGGVNQKTVTRSLDYLVLGAYVTPSWAHESFGRKIEKAVSYRDDRGDPLVIVSESHWIEQADHSGAV